MPAMRVDPCLPRRGRTVISAGARPETIKTIEIEDLPMSYVKGDARRVRVRVVGDIQQPTA